MLRVKLKRDTLADQVVHLGWGVHLQVCHNPGQSPGLVFLHGGMGNRFNWRAQYDFFHVRGREVLAYLLLLSPQVPAAAVLASLFAYRGVYYLLPLIAATGLLGLYEMRSRLHERSP